MSLEYIASVAAQNVGTTRVRIGGYTATKVAAVVGLRITNIRADGGTKVTVEFHDGTNYVPIVLGAGVSVGETLTPITEQNTLALPVGGGIFIRASDDAAVSAVMTLKEQAA